MTSEVTLKSIKLKSLAGLQSPDSLSSQEPVSVFLFTQNIFPNASFLYDLTIEATREP